jgi:cell division protease FtsH
MQTSRSVQFGKSRARHYDGAKKILFSDVAGQEEAKRELAEIVDFLKSPLKFISMGAKIPTGILLVGSPGTGKTLLARAVAGEAGVNFLHISGSDFVEMFVGVGASRVRDLFEQGRRSSPCIIFIDEIDAVGRARGAGFGGGHDEREQTLNQLLVEMDGFEGKDGIIVLAATNRPDVLDPALLRPGRFDRQVAVMLPDIKERELILAVHTKKIQLNDDVDLRKFARATPGMSGADLANMVNEAALFAARKSKSHVDNEDLEEARDKILMGTARKSMVLPQKERAMTACHEAGHALPYYYLDSVMPLHKVSIIPRGHALGITVGLPDEDVHSRTKKSLLDELVIMFGGYAAESIVYSDTTTGSQNDIRQATNLARKMVCEWGMSDEIGAVSYGQEDEPIFMGKEIARYKDYSEETAKKIDNAVRRLLDDAKKRAIELLSIHRKQLDVLSAALLEYETLSDAEIRVLLRVEPVRERSDFVSETGFTLDDDIKKRKQKRKTSSSSKAKPKEKELQGNLLFSQEDEVANTKKTEKSKTSRSSDVSNSSHE